MKAAWYERNGPAGDVLVVGELPDPEPGSGQLCVRVAAAGINPADVKRRSGAGNRAMRTPRVVPGDDGAGVVDRVGPGVPAGRIGERVWIHSANHRQSYGTSAELVVVPAAQAIGLPANTSFEAGACLGVPALTAHRCVFADGPVDGRTVLVTGGAGSVAHYAIELARHGGATVIATASTPRKQAAAREAGAHHVVDYREPDAATAILDLASGGVDRVVDVAFGANLPLTSAVIATNGVIASYASDATPEPGLPFYSLMRRGVTIRLVLVFVMPEAELSAAVDDVTRLLERDVLTHPIAARYALDDIATAHEAVEQGRLIGKTVIIA
ncbi:NADPH:quinone reductase [Fodinicola feengrottensis]|uniref:NADPH:quinone reductase n=1 Tax=Fodinicola feengrottensis TaxID=435914 RepID=A0ABN2J7C7_9ACTN|nr:NADPH:quinone reductase [Fodinicola feengrottensis]